MSQTPGEGSVSDKHGQICPRLQNAQARKALEIGKPVVTFAQPALGPLLCGVQIGTTTSEDTSASGREVEHVKIPSPSSSTDRNTAVSPLICRRNRSIRGSIPPYPQQHPPLSTAVTPLSAATSLLIRGSNPPIHGNIPPYLRQQLPYPRQHPPLSAAVTPLFGQRPPLSAVETPYPQQHPPLSIVSLSTAAVTRSQPRSESRRSYF